MKKKKNVEIIEEVDISPDEPVFTTGVVCRILGIPIWVLKQLDTEGLVKPDRKHERDARLYSRQELTLVKHCWYYIHDRGVNVRSLKIILEMEGGHVKAPKKKSS